MTKVNEGGRELPKTRKAFIETFVRPHSPQIELMEGYRSCPRKDGIVMGFAVGAYLHRIRSKNGADHLERALERQRQGRGINRNPLVRETKGLRTSSRTYLYDI